MSHPSNLIYPYGEPSVQGKLKQALEDFKVYEELGFSPTGEGEHLYLYVEKKDTTTDSVNQSLARHYGVKPYHIGDCGLKDAKAVTRQWFSVHLPGCKAFPVDPESDDYKILEKSWSHKKLKKGVHKGNTFHITIQSLEGDIDKAKAQIEHIAQQGFANYFGEQRFGKGKKNVANALDAFKHGKKLSRSKKSLYLSSLRSFIFNEVLVSRLKNYSWETPIEGDCYMLDGSRSTFAEDISDEIQQRYQIGDIHPIIALMGEGDALNSLQALAVETAIHQQHQTVIDVLEQQGLKRDKRPIRQNCSHLDFDFDDNQLRLSFYLPKGCYATTLIQHFCRY